MTMAKFLLFCALVAIGCLMFAHGRLLRRAAEREQQHIAELKELAEKVELLAKLRRNDPECLRPGCTNHRRQFHLMCVEHCDYEDVYRDMVKSMSAKG